MSTGRAIAGGLLVGLGEGMSAQGKTRSANAAAMREAALEEARAQRDRRWEQEDAETEHERSRGLIHGTATTDDNEIIGITKGGEKIDIGAKAKPKDGEGGKDGVSTATLNTMERVANRYWSTLNPDGQWILPEEARDQYTQTLERAEELAAKGTPAAKATRIAAQSLSGPMDEEKARKVAMNEARDVEFKGVFTNKDAPEKEEWLNNRAKELMDESRGALKEYQRLSSAPERSGGSSKSAQQAEGKKPTESKKAGSPPGSGTQAQPFKATSQSHIDWFKQSAPKGAIIEVDGKLYVK